MPNISKAQIEQAIDVISVLSSSYALQVTDMLQGLLDQPEGEPVEYQRQSPFSQGAWRNVVKSEFELLKKSDVVSSGVANVRALYTHPAPFTPISVDDVTDEMVESTMPQWMMSETDDVREIITGAVNAYLGAKK